MKRVFAVFLCFLVLCIPVRGAQTEKLVALTFDDGPSGRFTRRLLAGLEERNAKATFFLCGYRIEQYPELTQQIFKDGHEIGLHGYSHKSMENMPPADIIREIKSTAALLPENCKATFLRCPGGACSLCTCETAKDFGLSLLYWSVDPKDWATDNTAAIKSHILNCIQDGDIILLHDMSDSSVDAALAVIDTLSAQGYRFVTVSELAKARGSCPAPGVVYSDFRAR